ncbi:MAG: OmpA family protein [Pseudomonadota bacterium]|nr:OmpA family protein [Pseudomonadota bacterium]
MRCVLLLLLPLGLSACAPKHLGDPPVSGFDPAPSEPAKPPTTPEVQAVVRNFERVQFPLDSAEITASGKAALQDNVALLSAHLDIQVEIQGHCDERGSTDYNLALGQKRAQAVKRFLTAAGAAPSRLAIVSYGEERPLDRRNGDVAWAENRRAEFRVTQGGDGQVAGTAQ